MYVYTKISTSTRELSRYKVPSKVKLSADFGPFDSLCPPFGKFLISLLLFISVEFRMMQSPLTKANVNNRSAISCLDQRLNKINLIE